jgi:hypothetical protein
MTMEPHYLRGAFAAYQPEALLQDPPQLIPFRFNPEKLERTLDVGSGRGDGGVEVAGASMEARKGHSRKADAPSGSLTESFSVHLLFDFDDRHASMKLLPPGLGIAPEIAALELLVHPVETEVPHGSGVPVPRVARPTVLFIWGRMRVLPVRITSLTINELLFNAELNPTRAEAHVGLEVVPETNDGDRVVRAALQFTRGKRQALGRLFHEAAAAQGRGSILPL